MSGFWRMQCADDSFDITAKVGLENQKLDLQLDCHLRLSFKIAIYDCLFYRQLDCHLDCHLDCQLDCHLDCYLKIIIWIVIQIRVKYSSTIHFIWTLWREKRS